MQFYNKIGEILEKKGKSQKDLADAIDVHESSVTRWVKNTTQPTIKNLFLIAKFLGVSSHALLHKESVEETKTPVQT